MKNIFNKTFNIQFLMMLMVLLLPSLVHAQTDPGTDPDVPVDGGISLLLAAGVAYGVKKLKEQTAFHEYKDINLPS